MNKKKCPYCGGYLPSQSFYSIERVEGTLYIQVCPNCKGRISKWEDKR